MSKMILLGLLVGLNSYAVELKTLSKTDKGIRFQLKSEMPAIDHTGNVLLSKTVYAEPIGAPKIPSFSTFVAIPKGHTAVLKTGLAKTRNLSLKTSLPTQQRRRTHCTGSSEKVAASPLLTLKAASDPIASIEEISYAGPLKVALVKMRPVRVSSKAKTLRYSPEINFEIQFVPEKNPTSAPVNPTGLSKRSQKLFRSILRKEQRGDFLNTSTRADVELLIVSQSYDDDPTLAWFIQHKHSMGKQLQIEYVSSPSKEQIKAIIKKAYESKFAPNHTLFIGSIDQIPSFRRSSYWSDFPYALLDQGNYPDISVGRMPARNATELKQIVQKVIARENTQKDDHKILVTSGYETSWCHKNLAFIKDKIFDRSENPFDYTSKYASNGHKTDSIIDSYNDNPNIIVYDGHGNTQGMTEIPLSISHISRLKNSTYPIIFDIACLNSYWPSSGAGSENFAAKMISADKAGPAGILAASHNSNGHDLFRHMFRSFIYDELEQTHFHRVNEIGSVMLRGKLKYLEQNGGSGSALNDSYMFYYHGDPGTFIYSETQNRRIR